MRLSSPPPKLGIPLYRAAFETILLLLVPLSLFVGGASAGEAQTAHFLGLTSTVASGLNTPQGVAVDAAGNVYVADSSNLAVKKIPYSGGSYGTPVTLASVNYPFNVAVDGAGNVYFDDQSTYTVHKIPYSGGNYGTPVTLNSGCATPYGLGVDSVGNVFVADSSNHVVKEIPYAGGSYGTPVTVGSGFASPEGLAVDSVGNVFVADTFNHVVQEIPYSGGTYGTPVTLGSSLSAPRGVAVDSADNVFVTDGNAIKKLPYSGGTYGTPVALGSGFTYPPGVAVDAAGNVYVTDGHNAVQKISLAVNFGPANVSVAAATQTLTFQIDTAGTLGAPVVLTQGAISSDFQDAGTGTCTTNGTSHAYSAGDTCTVVVRFTPSAAWTRYGAVELTTNAGAVLATAYVQGTGNGAQVTYPPGVTSVFQAGFNKPAGVAIDGLGNIFVADNGNNAVKMIAYNGGTYSTAVALGSGFSHPNGVFVDGAGNVYVADESNKAVKKIPLTGGSYGSPVTLGSGFSYVAAVAVDGAGNVFVVDNGNGAIKKIPYSAGTYGSPVTLASGIDSPQGVAIDRSGNIFVSTYASGILEIPYNNGAYGPANSVLGRVTNFWQIALDGAGNLYVDDISRGAIDKLPYTNGSYGAPVVLASGFSSPNGIAVDSFGNLYVGDANHNEIQKVDVSDAPSLAFANTYVTNTSATQTVTVANTGNQPLTLPIPGLGSNPSLSANFSLSNSSTCPQLTSSSSSTGTLAAGASCTETLAFAPTMAGSASGSLILTDNAGNPASTTTQTISLSGTGLTGTTAQTITFPQPASPAAVGTTVTLTASSTSGQPITYSVVSGPATVSGSSLTYTNVGTVVVEADQYGNATYAAAAPVQDLVTVQAIQAVGVSSPTLTATVTIGTAGTFNAINVLTQGASSLDFNEASPDSGTCKTLLNTAVSANTSCTVQYTFTPTRPGQRFGGIVLMSSSAPLGQTPITGTGTGPLMEFPGTGVTSTLGSSFFNPYGVAVDSSGNVFVADYENTAVKEIPYGGGSYSGTPLTVGVFDGPSGVAVDGNGNVFVVERNTHLVWEILAGTMGNPAGVVSSASTMVTVGSGFADPFGVAVDGNGNVFVADTSSSTVFEIVAGTGGNTAGAVSSASMVKQVGSGFRYPSGVAVDAGGNVFVADNGNGMVKEVPYSGGSYSGTPLAVGSGFAHPAGVAVDAGGNVFVADGLNGVKEILAGTGGNAAGVVSTASTVLTVGSGFRYPQGVALDGYGHVFVADTSNNATKKIDFTVPKIAFNNVAVGSTSITKSVNVQNAGNADLNLSAITLADLINFSLDSTKTTCSTSVVVGESGICIVAAYFKPQTATALSTSIGLTDNNLGVAGATQSIPLSGTGIQGTLTVSVASTSIYAGATATTLTATVTFGGVAPTGAVTFSIDGGAATSAAACTSSGSPETCTLRYATGSLSVGAHTLSASIASDSNYNAVTSANGTLTIAGSGYTAPQTAVGSTSATQTATLIFSTSGTLSSINVLTQGAPGLDFQELSNDSGTCKTLLNTTVSAGTSCTVQYTFTPSSPGARYGAIVLAGSSGTLATAFLQGQGTGAQRTFLPGRSPLPLGSGYVSPQGVAVDGAGNLYVADTQHYAIKKIPYSNGAYGVPVQVYQLSAVPVTSDQLFGVAVDGAGNLYFSEFNFNTVQMLPNLGSSFGSPVTVAGGFIHPAGIAVDGTGTLYVADAGNSSATPSVNGTVYRVTYSAGAYGSPVSLGSGFTNPSGVAVDGSGNVYVADPNATNTLVKVPYSAGSYGTPVALGGSTFVSDHALGVAVDGPGNVYAGSLLSSSITRIPYNGTAYGTPVALGSGLSTPYGVALDGAGNVYVADTTNSAIKKIDLADSPTLSFAPTTAASTTVSKTESVVNTGNQALMLSSVSLSGSTAFARDNNTTCAASLVLQSTSSCNLVIDFTDNGAAGPYTGSVGLSDSVGTQTVQLVGTHVLSVAVGTTTPLQSATVTFTVGGVLGSINVLTQGIAGLDFQFASGGSCTTNSTYAANQSCTVNYTFKPAAPGQRLGAIVLNSTAGAVLSTTLIGGTGTGPQALFRPGVLASTITLSGAVFRGLTVDAAGNLFVSNTSDPSGNANFSVLKFTAGSTTPTTLATLHGTTISGTAVDGAGNVFFGSSAGIYEIPGGTGAPVLVNATIVNSDNNLAVDTLGNLFTTDYASGAIYELPAGNYGNAITLIPGGAGHRFIGMALDYKGNLFAADFNNNTLYELVAGANSLTVLSSSSSNLLSQPHAVAVDAADNVYVANYQGSSVYRFAKTNYSPAPAALAVQGQQGLAIGSDGSIYSVLNDATLNRYSRTSVAPLSFTSTAAGSSSSAQTVPIENDGNATLTISSVAPGTSQFTSSAASSSLAAGAQSTVSAKFTPAARGSYSDTVSVTSNAFNSPLTFGVSGTATGTAGTLTLTAASSTIYAKTATTTLSVSVTYNGVPPANTPVFTVGSGAPATSSCTGTSSPLTCTVSYATGSLVPNSYTISVSLAGDTNNSATTATGTLTVSQITSTITTPPTASGITYGQSLSSSTLSGGAASTAGTFAFTSPTTVPGTGTASYPVTFTPTDTTDYTTATTTVSVMTSKATPTITTAPTASGITYGQSLSSSTLSGGAASTAGTFAWTTPTIAPSAGTAFYSVTFTPADTTDYTTATLNVSVTTSKATPTITTSPTASGLTYGQSLSASTLSGGAASTAGTFAFTTPTTVPSAGTASYPVTFTPTDTTDYTTATVNVSVTTSKATPTITTAPTASGLTYGQPLSASTLSGGAASTAGTFAFTNSTTMPGAGTASYSVTFTPTDTTDYTTATTTVSVTTSKATPTITTALTASGITYGQSLSSSTLSGGAASTAGTFAFTSPTTVPSAGTSTQSVTFTPNDTTDYTTATVNVSVTTSKATPTITTPPTASGLTYGQSLSSSTLSGGAASTAGTFAFTNPATVPGAGMASYSVTFTPTDVSDYTTATVNVGVTVGKATPAITTAPMASGLTYGQSLSASTLSGGAASTAGTFAWSTPTTAPSAGTASYPVTFTPTDTTDYTTATANVSVTVGKATPTITTAPMASGLTYGQALSASTLSGGVASTAGTFAWTTPTITPSAGTATYAVTFAPTDTTDFTTATANVSVTVGKATPTITTAPTASGLTYGQPLSASTLSGGAASTAGTFAFTSPSTVPSAGTSTQSVTFMPTDTTDYTTATTTVSVTIGKATPAITVPPTASSITYGQTLAASTLSGGTASTAGTFAWTTPTTVPSAGTASYPVIFTPTDTADYTSASTSVSVTTNKATVAITFNVAGHTYGDAPFTVSASSSSTGAFTYSVVSGPATVSGSIITLTGAGSVTLKASQAADNNYAGNAQNAIFNVAAGTSSITFNVANHTYGDAPFTVSASSSSTGTFTYSIVSGPATVSGSTVTLTGAGTVVLKASQTADSNYVANSQNASFNVATGTAPITFNVANHTYGDAPFTVSASSSSTGAFTYSIVSGPATVSGSTVTLIGAGTVVLKASQAADNNYTANSQNATFSVTTGTAALTFTVPDHTYGDAPFTVSASSLSTGALTYLVVSGPATVSGSTVSINGIGTVTLQASQAADNNYAASTKQASFTIAVAPLVVTATNTSRPYGLANPAFMGTVTGQKYSDTFTESFSTTASSASAPGTYAIIPTVTGTNLPDYTVTTSNGTLTITQAATTTALTASATQLYPTQPATFTVTVASSTTGIPTGTATITDNGVALTTIALNNGTATYSTVLSPGTSHNLVATYSGDVDYFVSASVANTVTVVVSPLDFTFAPTTTNTALTGAPGSTLSYTFSIAPGPGGYPAPVIFSVTGLPTGATANFSPASIAANGGAQTVTLSIKLPPTIGENHSPFGNGEERTTAFVALLLPFVFSRRLRHKLRGQVLLSVLLFAGLAGMAALTGCGAGGGFLLEKPAIYKINVNATSGSISHTDVITLTVQ